MTHKTFLTRLVKQYIEHVKDVPATRFTPHLYYFLEDGRESIAIQNVAGDGLQSAQEYLPLIHQYQKSAKLTYFALSIMDGTTFSFATTSHDCDQELYDHEYEILTNLAKKLLPIKKEDK